MKNNTLAIYVAMLLSMVFWGISYIWSSQVLIYYKPVTTVFFRLILSSFFLISLGLILKRLQRVRLKDIWKIVLLSFLQPYLFFIGETHGLYYTSSTITAVIVATIPLFSPIAAYYFIKERISVFNILGIIISILGIILVLMNDSFELVVSTKGLLYLSLPVIASVFYSVMLVKMSDDYNVYTILTYQNTIGIVWFFITFMITDFADFKQVGFKVETIVPLLKLSLFASSLAFLFYIYGVRKVGVTKANAMANIIPVFTAVFAWLILKEPLSVVNVIGIAIVIVGLFLSQIKPTVFARTRLFFYRLYNKNK